MPWLWVVVRTLILARHAHAASNVTDLVSGSPPGKGLSPLGVAEARALQSALADVSIDLGACTELLRTQETLEVALEGRELSTLVLPELNEIGFGGFEGGPLATYRAWAWESEPDLACPGGGESRAAAAVRFSRGLDTLLARPEETVLAISHALPVRYVLDASTGRAPAARVERVEHAVPHTLAREAVETAVSTLREWAERPRFADTPFGGSAASG